MLQRLSVTLVFCLGIAACIDGVDEPGTGTIEAESTDYAATRYPIVLLPGILGFERMLGIVEYFPAIPEGIADGGGQVFIAYGSKANSSAVRAAQIIPQLEEIKAITGAARLNLVCHSQGAVDARIIAAERPDLVASVTSIGGPHLGAALADKVVDGSLGPLPALALGGIADLFTLITGSDLPNDIDAAMRDMSTAGMAAFNARYPAAVPQTPCGQGTEVVDGIRYYSWGGVGGMTNPVDLLDTLWLLGTFFAGGPSDGLIGQCSSHLGSVIRDDYPQNHIDETNMIFGLVSFFGPSPQSLYRQQANRLKNVGL